MVRRLTGACDDGFSLLRYLNRLRSVDVDELLGELISVDGSYNPRDLRAKSKTHEDMDYV